MDGNRKIVELPNNKNLVTLNKGQTIRTCLLAVRTVKMEKMHVEYASKSLKLYED